MTAGFRIRLRRPELADFLASADSDQLQSTARHVIARRTDVPTAHRLRSLNYVASALRRARRDRLPRELRDMLAALALNLAQHERERWAASRQTDAHTQ